MRIKDFAKSPVDHFIQSDIVSKLYKTPELTFSDLKEDDIENSLFMYHMNKLINRGVIEKTDSGFRLSTKGVRWVNFIGPSTLQPRPLPRLLINFIITDSSRNRILLSRRKGPASEILNEYLLPGGLYPYGFSRLDATNQIMHEMNLPAETTMKYETIYEKLSSGTDMYVHHSLSLVYSLILDDSIQPDTEHFALQWVQVSEVMENPSNKYGKSLVNILSKFIDDNLSKYESFTSEDL